jgi:cytidylate kinase
MNERSALPAPLAIDGPAASGKSTVAEALAEEFGYAVLDTGQTYRAFTYEALRQGIDDSDLEACAELAETIELALVGGTVTVNGEDVTAHLRDPDVERHVSGYSAIKAVRSAMVHIQRDVGTRRPTVVVGRDIGTVVFPNAPLKLFLTADPDERAERRSRQAGAWGTIQDARGAGVDIARRDTVDSSREVSPTKAADDAVVIDTSGISLSDVIEHAKEIVRRWNA